MQDSRPVCYASWSLTETESCYSNIERELLAACWSLEKFNCYVFGRKVVIETDHKPPESVWKKTIMSALPCLQRLLLKMAKYGAEIIYIQGKTNVIVDGFSRVSYMEPPLKEDEVPLLEVNAITSILPASPAKLEEIRQCTDQDVVLAHLGVVHHGWPEYANECHQNIKQFWNFREDLSVENGLILKRHHLVITSRLRPQMLQIIHQGHMGTEKCLLKDKESVFWPGISRDKGTDSQLCHVHTFSKQQPKETLCPHSAQFSMPEAWLRFVWLPRCTVPSSRRILQQIPHSKEAELDDICYNQSSQINICQTWNTRIPGYRQWTPIQQSRICCIVQSLGY